MEGFAKRLDAHMAKLAAYEALPLPREPFIEGSMAYHRDAIRHINRMLGRAEKPFPTVENPRDE